MCIHKLQVMADDIRIIQTEFFSIGNALLQETHTVFRKEAALIDRDGEENKYQLLRAKYKQLLRQLLEQKASALLNRSDARQLQGLGANLAGTIHYFETEFLRKADET